MVHDPAQAPTEDVLKVTVVSKSAGPCGAGQHQAEHY